jgi:opacity protein-like surface antigen
MPAFLRTFFLLFLTLATVSMEAAAQSADMFAPERVGRWYLSGGIGAYTEDANSQLANQDGDIGFFISGGYRLTPHIALEVDTLLAHQDFDTPGVIPPTALGSVDGRADLYSNGIGALVKLILPLDRVELYAGAGLGVYVTSLRLEGTLLGATTSLEDYDTDVGYQALIGADFYVARHVSVGFEYRLFKLDANFDSLIPGTLDMGGDLFFATVRGHF